jgi:hypothetical protein
VSADRDSVWDTLLIIFSRFEGWFCVLSGLFDETYKQEGQRLTGVGGFLFNKEQLLPAQEKLSLLGKPESASNIRARGDIDTLRTIARITADHRSDGFVVTISDDDYNAWKNLRPKNAEWLGPPYAICVIHLVDMLRKYLTDGSSQEEIFYTFEVGAKGEKQAKQHLGQMMESDGVRSYLRIRNAIFIPKDHEPDACILRSADLLINEWQRNHLEMERAIASDSEDSGWTEPFKLLFRDQESAPIRHYHISARALNNTPLLAAMMRLHPEP